MSDSHGHPKGSGQGGLTHKKGSHHAGAKLWRSGEDQAADREGEVRGAPHVSGVLGEQSLWRRNKRSNPVEENASGNTGWQIVRGWQGGRCENLDGSRGLGGGRTFD